jgi:hypothetical protein
MAPSTRDPKADIRDAITKQKAPDDARALIRLSLLLSLDPIQILKLPSCRYTS